MRLFAAVPIPEPGRRGVASALDALRPALPGAKWVAEELWHLTLAFFGEVGSEAVERLGRRLEHEAAPLPPFEARLEGLSAFPPRRGVRVVWLGFAPAAPAGRLAETVRAAATREAIPFDGKAFASHVTVARARRPWPPAARARLAGARPVGAPFAVERIALLSSRLGPSGPRYEAVVEAALAGPAA